MYIDVQVHELYNDEQLMYAWHQSHGFSHPHVQGL
jgi:hypothetical protein